MKLSEFERIVKDAANCAVEVIEANFHVRVEDARTGDFIVGFYRDEIKRMDESDLRYELECSSKVFCSASHDAVLPEAGSTPALSTPGTLSPIGKEPGVLFSGEDDRARI